MVSVNSSKSQLVTCDQLTVELQVLRRRASVS